MYSKLHQNINRQKDINITKPFNFSTYATDAVTTLTIALNETLVGSAHLNPRLGDVIESTVFTGASV